MKPRIYYDNRLADATPVASSIAAGDYSVINLAAWRGYRFFKFNALPGTVTVDCGSAKAANSLFVWGHNLFTSGNTLEIRGSTDNFAASDVLVYSIVPTSDKPFGKKYASQSFRYWRAKVLNGTPPTIAILVIGTVLELDGILTPDAFDPIARTVVGTTHMNELGQPMGKILEYVKSEQSITMRRVSWDWIRSTWLPIWNAQLRAEPCGWQWNAGVDPEPLLVSLTDSIETPHQANGYANLTFGLTAVRT